MHRLGNLEIKKTLFGLYEKSPTFLPPVWTNLDMNLAPSPPSVQKHTIYCTSSSSSSISVSSWNIIAALTLRVKADFET
jgi:hypothetical protein